MINNVVKFFHLKITLNNKNVFIFDIYDKRSDFLSYVNIFMCYNSCLPKSVYKNILLYTEVRLTIKIINLSVIMLKSSKILNTW